MDTLVAILMIVLFVVLMLFVFSIALLTPIIGKKNILFVVFIGFMVGIVGGAFFISPLYEDVPDMARGIYQLTSNGNETIGVDVATTINVYQFMEDVKKIDGVLDIESTGIIIKTDPFSEKRQKMINERIPLIDRNITSWKVYTNGTIILYVKKGYNPQTAINNLADWIMFTGEINTKYSIVHVSIVAEASQVDTIIKNISKWEIVVTGIEGPVEESIAGLNQILPDKTSIIILCGFIGMIVGLSGVFIDTILIYVNQFRDRILKREE
jgi:hypothetical protein